MSKEKYNQIKGIISLFIVIVLAFSIVRQNYTLSIIGVFLGILGIYTARQHLEEVLHDERSSHIQQKAASRTLAIVTAGLGILGVLIIEYSYRGYAQYRDHGYFMAYLALIIMSINGFFTWYYKNQLGG